MSAPVSGPIAIGALDLAALLCSRVCHDLISPVGAIVNGIEVMEEDKDEETKVFALDLIKKSAHQASAKLQFCRLAFGAAGSAGAQIDLGDAEKAARGLFEDGKTSLVWNLPRELLAKNRVKLLLNMLLIAAGTISRGGTLRSIRSPARGGNCRFHGHRIRSQCQVEPGHRRAACRQSCACRRRTRHSAPLCRYFGPGLRPGAFGGRRRRSGCLNRPLTVRPATEKRAFDGVGRFPQPKLNALTTH